MNILDFVGTLLVLLLITLFGVKILTKKGLEGEEESYTGRVLSAVLVLHMSVIVILGLATDARDELAFLVPRIWYFLIPAFGIQMFLIPYAWMKSECPQSWSACHKIIAGFGLALALGFGLFFWTYPMCLPGWLITSPFEFSACVGWFRSA